MGQRKAFYRQRIREASCARKESIDMLYLEAVDLDESKSQAVCFSGEPSINHNKKNNWSTPVSFDAGDKKTSQDKTSGLSSYLL